MKYITDTKDVESLLPLLLKQPAWGVDTETTGLDPHTDKVTLVQIGRPEEQYVIDARKVSIEPLRPFFESHEILKIGHNLKFDYKMLKGNFKIEMEALRDSLLCEKICTAGLKRNGFSLEDVMRGRLGIEMDKELQKSFIGHKGDFSKEQLEYAANDVKHLIPLMQKYVEVIKQDGLIPTMLLECNALSAFADMEFAGMRIDVEAWRELITKHTKQANEVKAKMDEYASKFLGLDLFGEVDINYGSPSQMVSLFNQMKIRVKEKDPVTGEDIFVPVKSTSDKVLKKLKDIPFVQQLKQWRGLQKRINTYGEPFLKAIHPTTGMIHPNMWQIGTDTGRPASGESDVNPLNIPRENDFRHCFVCFENEVVESDDFSGCESRILAEISGDQKMIEVFQKGEDIHCAVASDIYGVEVTKNNEHKKLRTPAKTLNFGIAYGMGPYSLYEKLVGDGFPITREEAKNIYYKYCEKYRTAVNFLRESGRTAVSQGYLSNLNGRRRYWAKPDPNGYRLGTSDPDYQGALAKIEREGGNFLIQSVNADITKQAMIDIRNYAKKNRIRTHFVNAIYDEIVTRTDKADSASFHEEKLKLMRQSAERWMKVVPMEVDGTVNSYWTKG
ncbi:MAG: hypothetical protein EBZ49_00315 [Proteobacteria bacterium]|nr:hypothetical protein [Pseudomonadota bacterium]